MVNVLFLVMLALKKEGVRTYLQPFTCLHWKNHLNVLWELIYPLESYRIQLLTIHLTIWRFSSQMRIFVVYMTGLMTDSGSRICGWVPTAYLMHIASTPTVPTMSVLPVAIPVCQTRCIRVPETLIPAAAGGYSQLRRMITGCPGFMAPAFQALGVTTTSG